MKKIFIVISLFTTSLTYGQVDLFKYFRPEAYFLSLLTGYEKLDFKWTLKDSLQLQMNEGINALESRNFRLAVDHFSRVLRSDSTFGPAKYYRGVSYMMSRNFRKAETDLETTVKLKPECTPAYLELGDLYLLWRNGYKASRFYRKANKIAPSSIPGQLRMGIFSLYEGDKQNAIRYFENCCKLKPNYPDAYLAIGIVKFMDKETKEYALGYFAKSIQVDSLFTMGYFWRGLLSTSQQKLDLAERDWSHSIQLEPNNVLLYQFRALLYIELKKYEEAFSDIKKIMSVFAIDEDQAPFMGTSLDKKIGAQNLSDYLARFGYGLKEETFSSLKKGLCLMLIEKYKESLDATNASLKSEPTTCALYLKGLCFQFSNSHDSAYYYFNRTVEADPEIFDVHKNLAIYQTQMKNWKGATFHLNKMRQLQPHSEVTWRLSGLIKAELKDYYGALLDLTHYLKYDTADETCLRIRAAVRYRIEDFKGSIEDYKQLKQLYATNSRGPEIGINVMSADLDIAISENYLLMTDTLSSIETLRNTLKLLEGTQVFRDEQLELTLADRLIDVHKFDEAKVIIKKIAKRSYFGCSRCDYLNCRIDLANGNVKKAFKEISELITKVGEKDQYIMLRAAIYIKDNKLDLARKDLSKLKANDYKLAKAMILKYEK